MILIILMNRPGLEPLPFRTLTHARWRRSNQQPLARSKPSQQKCAPYLSNWLLTTCSGTRLMRSTNNRNNGVSLISARAAVLPQSIRGRFALSHSRSDAPSIEPTPQILKTPVQKLNTGYLLILKNFLSVFANKYEGSASQNFGVSTL